MIHILVRFKPYPHIHNPAREKLVVLENRIEKSKFLECWYEQQDRRLPVELEATNQFFKPELVSFTHHQDFRMRKALSPLEGSGFHI